MQNVPRPALHPTEQISEQLNNGIKEKVGRSNGKEKDLVYFHHKKGQGKHFLLPEQSKLKFQ